MTTYVLRNGKLVEKAKAFYHEGGGAAYVISDTQDLLWHPVANKYTDSKSRFRQWTVAANCREVGNDVNYSPKRQLPKLDKAKRVDDIKRSIYQLRNGHIR